MTARTPRARARRLLPWTIGAFAVVLAASAGVATYRARLPHPANAPAHRVCVRGEQASYAFRLSADGRVHPITLGGSAAHDAAPLPYQTKLEGELRVTC